jgi:Leucine-rich repeat (LRR) protein
MDYKELISALRKTKIPDDTISLILSYIESVQLGDFDIIKSELKNANMADYYIEINDEKELKQLTKNIRYLKCKNIIDVSPLSSLVNLRELNLFGCNNITDITPLASLVNLQRLNLAHCNNITDISALFLLVNLRYLTLRCNNITEVSALSPLVNLRELKLTWCRYISFIITG